MQNNKEKEALPRVIGVRTNHHEKHIKRWRKQNQRVPWSVLLKDALDKFFENGKAA